MEKSVTEPIDMDCFPDVIKKRFSIKGIDTIQYSPLTLAYIGDAIYDLTIRTIIVEKGNAPVNTLHRKVSALVNATYQAKLIRVIKPLLTEAEISIFRRGRNAKSATTAKNATILDYRNATGFEALMGYLYLENQMDRALELIKYGLLREPGM